MTDNIFIKGMKMPEEGQYRIFIVFGDGDVTDRDGKVIGTAIPIQEHVENLTAIELLMSDGNLREGLKMLSDILENALCPNPEDKE